MKTMLTTTSVLKVFLFFRLNTLAGLQTCLIQAQGVDCQLNYEHSHLRLSSLGVLCTEGRAQAAHEAATSHAPVNIWRLPPCLLCCLSSPVFHCLKQTCWKPSAILLVSETQSCIYLTKSAYIPTCCHRSVVCRVKIWTCLSGIQWWSAHTQ